MDKEIKERREYLRKILSESFIEGVLAALKNGHYWKSMGEKSLLKHVQSLALKHADSILPAEEPDEVPDER
ncbi:MAG: hypothetical protein WC279_14010 [Sulfurimonas sp.]|jgi:hypothetical protein|uniref:hypothetical protein n=1 Tax=Sulfurimonas sp. TaxID=2022749 RepID=UPI00356A94BA